MAFFYLSVHAIDDPLTSHRVVRGRCRRFGFNFNDEVFRLKEEVEKAFGIPAIDQRYHGLALEMEYGENLLFRGDRILQNCEDDDRLHTVLQNLYNEEIIDSKHTIAVVHIPPPFHTPKVNWSSIHRRRQSGRTNPSQFHDEDGNDSDGDVEVLRDVDTVQERIDSGRDDAIVIGDEDSSEGENEEEQQQPRQKRARQAIGESETEPQARRDDNGIGQEEQDQEREAANEDSNEEEEEADEAEEVRADNGEDEGGNAALNVEAGGAEQAAATEGEDVQPAPGEGVQAPAPEGPPTPSELRRWLRGLHADGRHANAFDAYAAAFEREFRSLEDLALAADNAPEGLEGVLRACGVRTLGDKARLRWAIAGLPRPVGPAGVDGAA